MAKKRTLRKEIEDALREHNPDALLLDGFEDAYIGPSHRQGQPTLATYSYKKCIEVLVEQGMTHEGAIEFFEFNTLCAWVGPHTPIILLDNLCE